MNSLLWLIIGMCLMGVIMDPAYLGEVFHMLGNLVEQRQPIEMPLGGSAPK